MKIRIDMQGVQTPSRHRGIGRYTQHLTEAFLRIAAERHEVGLLFNAALGGIDDCIASLRRAGLAAPRSSYGPIRRTSSDNPGHQPLREAAERVMTHVLDASGADAVWLSSVMEGFHEDALAPHGSPSACMVATLYDLIPLHDAEQLGRSRARDWYLSRLEQLKRCDLLLAISSWVRDDAVARLGIAAERIAVIGAGVDPRFTPAAAGVDALSWARQRFGIDRPFVFYSGGFDERKNVPALLSAFAALPAPLREAHRLVIAGRLDGADRARLGQVARQAGLARQEVVFTGFVSDEELIGLYQACALFVFPSAQEGFGLPPLEAMACGACVLANDSSSLPEVVGAPEHLFDSAVSGAMTQAMQAALQDEDLRQRLRENGLRRAAHFSWNQVAERALAAIETRTAQVPRRRPASVMPAPAIRRAAEAAELAGTAVLPLYRVDTDSVCELLPLIRQWPGCVEWSGPWPAPGRMQAADKYRLRGYAGLTATEQPGDWRKLLEQDAVAVREAQDPSWDSAIMDHAWTRQRLMEDDIAQACAARLKDGELAQVADALDRARPRANRRWLIDVTHIAHGDLRTGVQRVVRSILGAWLRDPPDGVRIEPVMFRDGRYRHAHAYACELLGIAVPADLPGDIVGVSADEVFVGLDWSMESLPSSAPLLRRWREAGVAMHFIVHDILPVTLPEAFHAQTRASFRQWLELITTLSDVVHCVSRSTAEELSRWLATHDAREWPQIAHFLLGADPQAPRGTGELDAGLSAAMKTRPSLLMVGTLEPRKGHGLALEAFELLWSAGVDANLVIVGRQGWLVGELVSRLDRHEERGKRLFWLDNVDDDVLHAIYTQATALLAPSLGEGFGLPLIEAAQRGKPIIARALPVFREVAGDYPSYFEGRSAAQLATHITRWLIDRPRPGAHPTWFNWKESADMLARSIMQA
ncbi:glycosyltransferase family 1 protein [Dyella sp. BiH032]|uniref:glycosyltransferase family 4 protein n=1 Tax=Dyella sp. BiH032 TaxID=3075430 RepID=UPI0028937C21|nr:glycosyltransferase family 1 protein [Dyella sp. BiH032]WNL45531.1 glycosyltransferase family 1 protein [Dyella sp. BiH032]